MFKEQKVCRLAALGNDSVRIYVHMYMYKVIDSLRRDYLESLHRPQLQLMPLFEQYK